MPKLFRPAFAAALLALVSLVPMLPAPPADAPPEKTPGRPDAGVCVVVPAADGAALADLTNHGRVLVHGLALDDGQRDRARATLLGRKLYGLATAVTWPERGRLPYPDHLVTLLVVDADALGGDTPPAEEMDRVLAPYGQLRVKRAGRWVVTDKARPKEMGDWGHFDGDAAGNAVTPDTLVGPPRLPQWITGIQGNPFEGNPAGYSPGGGLRVAGRHAVLDVDAGLDVKGKRVSNAELLLQCRDAFNGVPLWSVPRDDGVARRRWSLVADGDRVYTYLRAGGELTALDAATGKTLATFAGTAPEAAGGTGKARAALVEETTCVRVRGETLVVTHNDRLLCFDARTGKHRWTFRREGRQVLGPSLTDGHVYCFVAALRKHPVFGLRWPYSTAIESVVALDRAGGTVVWENTDVASVRLPPDKAGKVKTRGAGQLLPVGAHLVVFGSCAIGGGESPFVASLDRATGKTRHLDDHPVPIRYNSWAYNALAKGGRVYFGGAFFNFWRYDPETGKTDQVLGAAFNQRCTRLTATSRYFLFGQAAYWDDRFAGEQVCVARSGCAIGNLPANGLTYFTPNACECITQMRGFQALTSEQPGPAWGESQRRSTGSPAAAARPAVAAEPPAEPPAGALAAEWTRHWRLAKARTEPVRAGELSLVATVHGHCLEARRGDAVVWRFHADGRISSPPVVADTAAVFGAHDGAVYAVDLRDGRLRWKYLVAPRPRWWQAYGQLESTWPVYGVALHEGKVIASAGTHVELAGGVTVVALEPATGTPAWRKVLHRDPATIPPGGKGARIVGPSFLNSVPRVADGRIVLGDGGRVGGQFAFRPDEDEATLRQRLAGKTK